MGLTFRPYIETTAISDWLLVETTTKNKRKILSEDVLGSHNLINFLIHDTDEKVQPFTSFWGIFEAVGVIKKSNIEVRMVVSGIPTNLYQEVKEQPGYRLEDFEIQKIKLLIKKLTIRSKGIRPLRVVAENSDIDAGISVMLEKNLEAPDSFHLGIAFSYGCDYFVTRDHHYFRKNTTEFLGKKIKIKRPRDFIEILNKQGVFTSTT